MLGENIRGALCYTLGFVSGVFFLLFDTSPFVRFHALQSTLTFSTIAALSIILPVVPGGLVLSRIVLGLSFIVWAICIIKASKGEYFKLPVFGEIAESQMASPFT